MYAPSYYSTYGPLYYVGIDIPDPSTVVPVLGFVTVVLTKPYTTTLVIGAP